MTAAANSPEPPAEIPRVAGDRLWDRQDGEPSKAFEKFAVFRDLGPSRTLGATAIESGVSRDRTIQLSALYGWVDRVRAFDAHQDQTRLLAAEEAIRSMVERDIEMAQGIKSRVVERLNAFDPDELNPTQLARWFELAVKAEREARGMSTNQIEVRHSGEQDHDSAIVRAIVADPVATEHALAALERVALVGRQSGASGDSSN